MSSLFSTPNIQPPPAPSPKPQLPPAPSPAPKNEDKAVQQAVAEAIRRRQKSRGFRSTILSKDFMKEDTPALKETLGT